MTPLRPWWRRAALVVFAAGAAGALVMVTVLAWRDGFFLPMVFAVTAVGVIVRDEWLLRRQRRSDGPRRRPGRLRRAGLLIVGYARSLWWGVIRSEAAQRRMMQRGHTAWSGKCLHPDDLDELIAEQRPRWRRAHR